MKRFLLFLFLSYSLHSFAQSYSEKYNSVLNRYEYYNSQGTMIGYKTYNSLRREWNYTDISQPAQTYTPTSSINLPLIQQVMASKQKQYDQNSASISNQLDYVSSYFNYFNMYSKYPQIDFFKVETLVVMKEYIDVMDKYSRADLGNNYTAQSYKNDLKYIIRKLDNIYEKVKHFERDPNYYKPNTEPAKNQPRTVYVENMAIIWDNWDLKTAENIGFVSKNQVTVLEKTTDKFYKIQYGKIIGYMTEASLFPK